MSLFFVFVSMCLGANTLQFEKTKIFTPVPGSDMTAAYFKATNPTDKTITLKIATAEGFGDVETHETITKNGKMEMTPIAALEIKPHSTLEFKPGGKHIMLFEPKKTYRVGDKTIIHFKIDSTDQPVSFSFVERE